ncbi:MAG: mannose-1-phosphate guanylyltransferase/mannose-6-phosphate isomerase [Hellea sp.]|nr:mannose-1-phosphate guanylyltransferase/mannose-6-phosphate isomerase [Hellea sp.]
MTKIIPVIMSGGAGSRLWPLSRRAVPKQLLPLVTEKTMVQETALRFDGDMFADPVFICNRLHVEAIDAQMSEIDRKVGAFIVEPVGRNTAPCAVVAAVHGADADGALVMLVPADHHVTDVAAFQAAVARALPIAQDGYLVTFGIKPDGPETGYGYIAQGKALGDGAFKVDAFEEKPDLPTAKSYLADGGYAWNAGIFLFRPDDFLSEAHTYAPEIAKQAKAALKAASRDGNVIHLDADKFAACPSESIDYAIMEHTQKAAVVPCSIGWNDIGSYLSLQAALAEIDSDDDQNALAGAVMTVSSDNCLVQTDGMPVSIVGVSNVGVIVHEGEILVVGLDQAQDVKKVVNRLKEGGEKDRL